MDEEDGRPGARARQPGRSDVPTDASTVSLCRTFTHFKASGVPELDAGSPIHFAGFAKWVGDHDRWQSLNHVSILGPGADLRIIKDLIQDEVNHENVPGK